MNRVLSKLPEQYKEKLKKRAMPRFEDAMLATLTEDYFSDPEWIYERKFDGVRCLVFKNGSTVTLKSRNNKKFNTSYPEIVKQIKKCKVAQVVLDGEIVAFKGKVTSFQKLQPRFGLKSAEKARSTGIKIYMYIFDMLYLDGYDLTKLPLIKRKSLLKQCITFKNPLRYSTHIKKTGLPFYRKACSKGWEGIIAKKRDSEYVHKRSKDWLKFKCVKNQELVIGGYTEPEGSRVGFGSLLMGYYKRGKFMYAGKVGTGFSDEFLKTFFKKLKKITIKKNPFSTKEVEEDNVHFVKPQLVAEIGFEEWTRGNKLRHPRFIGLRYDKKAKDVVKEAK